MSIIKLIPVGLSDIPALEHWFEEMASKGLHLEDCLQWIAYFKPGPPAQVRYRLEPIDKFQVSPTPEQEQLELYKESGWHYVNTVWRCYYAFVADDPSAPELHTDPKIQSMTLTRLINRTSASTLRFFFSSFLPAVFYLFSLSVFPVFWAAALYLRPTLFVLSVFLAPIPFFVLLHRLIGLRRLQRQLEQGIAPEYKPGKPWFPLLFKVHLALSLVVFLLWGWGYINNWEKDGKLEELVPFPLLTLQQVEQDENLKLEPMHHVKAMHVTIGSFVEHTWYDLAPESYTVHQINYDVGDLKIEWFDLLIPSTAQPITQDLFILKTAPEYQDKRFSTTWTVTPISHSDTDLILSAAKEDGWLVCAAKGDKVVLVEYTGTQNISSCLDSLVAMVTQ